MSFLLSWRRRSSGRAIRLARDVFNPLPVRRTKYGKIPELTRPSKREREEAIAAEIEEMLDEHDLGVKSSLDALLDPPKRR